MGGNFLFLHILWKTHSWDKAGPVRNDNLSLEVNGFQEVFINQIMLVFPSDTTGV